jgi:hypothetical protein
MQSKVTVTLIVFLFPALIGPLLILALLTRLPGPVGVFFLDYSFAWLWGTYLLLAAGAAFAYIKYKRYQARQAAASPTADTASSDDAQPMVAESPQS